MGGSKGSAQPEGSDPVPSATVLTFCSSHSGVGRRGHFPPETLPTGFQEPHSSWGTTPRPQPPVNQLTLTAYLATVCTSVLHLKLPRGVLICLAW